jgi:hypothetical protein
MRDVHEAATRHQGSRTIRTRPQAWRPAPGQAVRQALHAMVLFVLALATTTSTVHAAQDSGAWTSELQSAQALGPQGRPIKEYPDQLLLPARDSSLISGLVVQSATASQRGLSEQGTPFYQVTLGRDAQAGQPVEARFFGTHGGALFPSLGGNPARPTGCAASADYCTDSLFGPGGVLTTEIFFNLASGRGDRAQVTHNLSPNGASWAVVLYRPSTDQVFGFTLHGATADRAGSVDLDPTNRPLAQRLVDQATSFAPVVVSQNADLAALQLAAL